MPPGRRRRHGYAHTALAILLAALPVIPLPLAAASAVPEAAASPGHATASGSGYANASALAPVHNAVGGTSGPAPYDPLHAEEWFVRQRAYPLTAIPTGARLHALAQLAALRRAHAGTYSTSGSISGASATTAGAALLPATAATGTWQHVGTPGQQTNTTSTITVFTTTFRGATNYGAVGGRVTTLAIDPNNAKGLYAGTAGGGVWKSTDDGATWATTTDAQPSLAIGALAIAPTAPYTIYAMTGEGNNSGDSYYGAGLLESTNGGSTWALTGTDLGKLAASRLVLDPLHPSVLYAAMNPTVGAQGLNSTGGIYRSTDGGATWTLSLDPGAPVAGGGCAGAPSLTQWVPGSDIAVANSGGTTTVYAALGTMFGCTANGIFKSTDNGQSWTRLHGFDAVAGTRLIDPTSGTTDVGRIALATAPSNPSVVYAAVEVADPGRLDDGTLGGVYESTDGGTTWVALARPNDLGFNDQLANQYWYDLYVAVDPIDPSTVYLGGVDAWKGVTTSAGTVWTNLTNSYPNANDNYQPGPVHPDQHALVVAPGGAMYAGNDGGVYKTTDRGATWTDLNAGLDAIQLYGASVSAPGQATLIYRGAQDNDVSRYNGTGPWTSVVGGDGTVSAIDPTNTNTAYVSTEYGEVFKTTDGGNTWVLLTGGGGPNDPAADSPRLGFVTPLALDQANPNRLLMGTYRLWESTNGGAIWNVAGSGPDLTGGSSSDAISALAIAPGASSVVYAGTSNGYVQTTTNDGSSWTDGTGVPNRFVTSIAVSATLSSVAWAAFSGFDEATPSTPGHVFQTTDGGHTWHNVSGNLPDVPVNALVVDPTNGALYAGTDVGVFMSTDDGAHWTPLGNGLPNAPVFGLTLRGDGVLYAATHGRGLWSMPVDGTVPPTATATPTSTTTPLPTSTRTPLPTSTRTPGPTNTNTPAPTSTTTPLPTNTPAPTSTQTPLPTSAQTPLPTSTRMPIATGTSTLVPTNTSTPAPTSTNTSVPPPSKTPLSSSTPVPSPTSTPPKIAPATTPLPPTSTATTMASPTATATTRPAAPHNRRVSLSLTLLTWQRRVIAGDTLAVRIHTVPHAWVSVGVQIVAQKVVVTGQGKHRRRVTHTVVLYQARLQGTANGRGQFSGTVRITYQPAKSVPARLTVTVRMAQRMASRTVGVTILPGRHARRH